MIECLPLIEYIIFKEYMMSSAKTVEWILYKYFKKPNLFGTRYCKYFGVIRWSKKYGLQRKYYYWESTTWKAFNEILDNHITSKREKKVREAKENDLSKLDWDFEDNKE